MCNNFIDRKIEMMVSSMCCVERNRNEVCALDANKLHKKIYEKDLSVSAAAKMSGIDISVLRETIFGTKPMTIGDAICLKEILMMTNEEAVDIFLS